MIIGIDPKIDRVFRILFGQKKNAPILMDLLNAILEPLLHRRIEAIEILDPSAELENLAEKLCIVDVKARDSEGRFFDVEMQRFEQSNFQQRVLYYWSRLYGEQMKSGDDYEMLRPSILVCIADFEMFSQCRDFFMTFELYNRKNGIVFNSDIQVITLEVTKYKGTIEEIESPLDAWMCFLRDGMNIDIEHVPTALRKQPGINLALGQLDMLSKDEEEMMLIRTREKYERDALSQQRHYERIEARAEAAEAALKAAEKAAEAKAEAAEKAAEKAASEARIQIHAQLAEMVIGLLRRRLGVLDPDTIQRVDSLPVDELRLLGEALFDLADVNELKTWLKSHTSL